MKKQVLYLFIFTFSFLACEKDDFCTEEKPKTPKLILRFYNNADKDQYKTVKNLSVWAEGKDTISAYKSIELDSIAIPLNTLTTETIYYLKMNSTDGNLATNFTNKLTIKYTTEDVYISRSCGYKVYFNDVEIASDNGWFLDFVPTNFTPINNEQEAHVKVYH